MLVRAPIVDPGRGHRHHAGPGGHRSRLGVAVANDEPATAWLEANGRGDLRASTWAPRKYEAYLAQMEAWAKELRVTPETVEYLIFQDEADRRPGNQWVSRADGSGT